MSSSELCFLKRSTLLAVFVALLFGGCAMQQDVNYLNDRLNTLEERQQASTAQRQELLGKLTDSHLTQAQKEQSLREELAQFQIQMDDLRNEIRRMAGGLEETAFKMQQLDQSTQTTAQGSIRTLADAVTALEQLKSRVAYLEEYMGLEAKPAGPPSAKVPANSDNQPPATAPANPDMPPAASPQTADELYDAGKRAFDQEDFETARRHFTAVLEKDPKSGIAGNAQFWIGEIYYRDKWFEKAILEYQKVIENYSKGNKVAAALLKQGFAFLQLGDKSNAKLILKELIKRFPKANEAIVAQKKLKEI